MMRKILLVLTILFSSIAAAQTEYDIAVFLENARNEVPRADDLDFYLNAGKRLLEDGRREEADVFFDFAASLGSEEGFRGKAASGDDEFRDYYQAFSERRTPTVDRLMRALASSKEDVASALLVHDNLQVYRLKHLRDPLMDWMPSSQEDSVWLRKNDGITYSIAQVKEENGNWLDALLLYDLAAWEGNYEALNKVKIIGTDTERKWKDVLIGRFNRKREYVLLHKYLAGEELSTNDYEQLFTFMTTPDERLISVALGISDGAYILGNGLDYIPAAFALAINTRKEAYSVDERIQKLSQCLNESESLAIQMKALEAQNGLSEELKESSEELQRSQQIIQRLLQEQKTGPRDDLASEFIERSIENLIRYIKDHPQTIYSKETIAFIKNYYRKNPKPWRKRVLAIVKSLPTDTNKRYSRTDNLYYPLYEAGLLSRIHHTAKIRPEQLNIDL